MVLLFFFSGRNVHTIIISVVADLKRKRVTIVLFIIVEGNRLSLVVFADHFFISFFNNTFLPDTWPFGRDQSIAVVLVHPPPPPQPTTTTCIGYVKTPSHPQTP